MNENLHIAVVDDDEAVLESLRALLARRGMSTSIFGNARSFLDDLGTGQRFDCVVSDIRMPGMTGRALQLALRERGNTTPLIFITGHGDVDMAVAALKAGADDFIEKPIDNARLVKSIREAAAKGHGEKAALEKLANLRKRYEALSDRQREVMLYAAQGHSNKEIASILGLSARTVEHYREWVMEKMSAKNVAELVQMAMRLQVLKVD